MPRIRRPAAASVLAPVSGCASARRCRSSAASRSSSETSSCSR
jgi:hypothetical protein